MCGTLSGGPGGMLCPENFENCIKEIDNLGYFERVFKSFTHEKFVKFRVFNDRTYRGFFFTFLIFGGGSANF